MCEYTDPYGAHDALEVHGEPPHYIGFLIRMASAPVHGWADCATCGAIFALPAEELIGRNAGRPADTPLHPKTRALIHRMQPADLWHSSDSAVSEWEE